MKNTKIRPCPFCGCTSVGHASSFEHVFVFNCTNQNCKSIVCFQAESFDEAITKWNNTSERFTEDEIIRFEF